MVIRFSKIVFGIDGSGEFMIAGIWARSASL
jgi:hypothetical protein